MTQNLEDPKSQQIEKMPQGWQLYSSLSALAWQERTERGHVSAMGGRLRGVRKPSGGICRVRHKAKWRSTHFLYAAGTGRSLITAQRR